MTDQIHIGTSGWSYQHWKNIFYPEDLPAVKWLEFYSKKFKTVEINNSFYRLPEKNVFEKWYRETPVDFKFSIKVSRYISHIERLKNVKGAWGTFLKHSKPLKDKLGVYLIQFPPSFAKTDENKKRLEKFLKFASKEKLVFEFRHDSWGSNEIYELLSDKGSGWVIANSSRYPNIGAITSNVVYFRMHGPEDLFSSLYPKSSIKLLSSEIKRLAFEGKEVFAYFNNDVKGYALINAEQLVHFMI